jgi:ubiquitin C-terminal hydrolase
VLLEFFKKEADDSSGKEYKKHINRNNPLGMGGAMAETLGQVAQVLADRDDSVLAAPHQLTFETEKLVSEFQQYNSYDLLPLLLDVLHEDMNHVREKPYVDVNIVSKGRSDKEIADETWDKHALRNQSVIVNLFQGQLKSNYTALSVMRNQVYLIHSCSSHYQLLI